ncbi:MAG: hypothetical protein JWR38_4303 [Mucilaginibacter sp.]|nr:hypothetical protein [Mucilaginibacter sp.]
MSRLNLSLLEFGKTFPPEQLAHHVINNLFEDVSLYENLGYKRLWLSEHYSPEFAWFNPEMLMPLLAGYSEKIKIGLAGVLLGYHSPLRVAQNFKILSSIYAGRIDLGLARASVPENTSVFLISKEEVKSVVENWETKVAQLVSFLRNWEPEKSLLKNMIVPPHGTDLPDVWVLGASGNSVNIAVENKANFCLSFMHPGSNYRKSKDVIKRFKEEYLKKHLILPETSVLLASFATDDKDLIQRYGLQYNQEAEINPFGPADYIKEELVRLQRELESDEFVIYCPVPERCQRIAHYQSIIDPG